MLGLTSPLWLVGLAALAIPILIHLLSRKNARRIRVGSIALLKAATPRQVRRLALTDIPLLLLRLSILSILVLALTGLHWLGDEPPGDRPARWALVSIETLLDATDLRGSELMDSLVAAGHELHVLAAGLPTLGNAELVPTATAGLNYWSLLREADRLVPPGSDLVVVAPARLSNHLGKRPKLRSRVTWMATSPGRTNQWIADARVIRRDSMRLTIGTSDSAVARYRRYVRPLPPGATVLAGDSGPPIEVRPTSSGWQVRLPQNPSAQPVDVQPAIPTTTVQVLHDGERAGDAAHVAAALRAVSDFRGVLLDISLSNATPSIRLQEGTSIVFWLSTLDIPTSLLDAVPSGLVLFRDTPSPEYEAIDSRIIMEGAYPDESIGLWRRGRALESGTTVWRDGFGSPLLTAEAKGTGTLYHLAGRFDPLWSDLVLSQAFPLTILALASGGSVTAGAGPYAVSPFDQRTVSPPQRQAGVVSSIDRDSSPAQTELRLPLLLIVAVLFGWERSVTSRRVA